MHVALLVPLGWTSPPTARYGGGLAYSVKKRGIACRASDMCQALGVPVYAVVVSEVRMAWPPCHAACAVFPMAYETSALAVDVVPL